MDWWEDWWKIPEICWEVLKFIRYREVAFICVNDPRQTRRFINIITYGNLIYRLKQYYYYKRNNLFHFFASIERVKKSNDQGTVYNLKRNWNVIGWDLVIDLDGKGQTFDERIQNAYQQAKLLKEVMDSYELPYAIVFSGSKGFHFWIPWEHLRIFFKPQDYGAVNRKIAMFLAKQAGIKIDPSTLSTGKDLIRVPYSPHPITKLIALPLTDDQFENFHYAMANPVNVLNLELKNRGMLFREGKLDNLIKEVFESDYKTEVQNI